MGARIACTALAVITLHALAGAGFVAEAQGTGDDYYYVDNRKVALAISDKYTAVALKPDLGSGERQTFKSSIKASGVGEVEESPMLQKYGIVLVRAKKEAGPTAFRSGVAPLMSRPEVKAEVPVYSIGGADAVLVNEFIVQFKTIPGGRNVIL